MKKIISILMICILLLSMLACSATPDEMIKDPPTDINELGGKLYIGQTYEDVCKVLGSEGLMMTSDLSNVLVWDFGDIGSITVSFNVDTSKLVSTGSGSFVSNYFKGSCVTRYTVIGPTD